jgi:hypothetical protein
MCRPGSLCHACRERDTPKALIAADINELDEAAHRFLGGTHEIA